MTLATGDRVLVKNQTAGAENGIYVVGPSPARAEDFDTSAEIVGAIVLVTEGTANADTLWTCVTTGPITVGTTALVLSQIGGTFSTTPPIAVGEQGTGELGSALTYSRSDHRHKINNAFGSSLAPSVSAVGDAASAGGAGTVSHRDHVHGREGFGSPVAVAATNSNGTATTVARSDHVHAASAADPGDIADPSTATPEDVANKINDLMAAMRTAGLLA